MEKEEIEQILFEKSTWLREKLVRHLTPKNLDDLSQRQLERIIKDTEEERLRIDLIVTEYFFTTDKYPKDAKDITASYEQIIRRVKEHIHKKYGEIE